DERWMAPADERWMAPADDSSAPGAGRPARPEDTAISAFAEIAVGVHRDDAPAWSTNYAGTPPTHRVVDQPRMNQWALRQGRRLPGKFADVEIAEEQFAAVVL
ncbi:MAG: hypothetical protein ACPGXX_15465, partial [Planctomycetaceae bacterium]